MIKFLKKYYLIVSAIVCSLLFIAYYLQTFSTRYDDATESFKSNFVELEKELDNILRYRSDEVDRNGLDNQWEKISDKEQINVHIYSNDSLKYWNTNQLPIIRFADIHFPSEGLLHLQNGWYYAKTKQVGDYVICGSFLIKQDYSYKNDDLINDFPKRLSLPFTATITVDQDAGYPVYSADGKFVFSLYPNEYQSATRSESIALMFLLLTSIVLWLYWLLALKKKIASKWNWSIPFAVVLLRVLSLKYSWFGFMHGTLAFDPSLYGTNQFFPNFFEYLINIALLIYLMYELGTAWKSMAESKIGKVFSVLVFVASFLIWGMFLYFTKGLVEDSSIPLVIEKLFSLNIFSLFAVGSLGVFFYAYFHFIRNIVHWCENQKVTGAQLAVISFIASCSFFFYEVNYGYQLALASLFPIVFYEFVLYLVYRHKKNNQLGTGIILLLLFSIVTASNLWTFNDRKERGERELYANQLATEKNIVTEDEYSSLAELLKEDNFLKRFISEPRAISLSAFQEGLERRLFNGYWERYEMEFNLFNDEHIPLLDARREGTEQYDEFQEIINRSGQQSELDSNIYFINDHTKHYSYIIRQELYGKDSTDVGIFVATLKSKKIPEEIGFPRLLISSKANVLESLESYSIAKYHDGKIITKYGAFNYPSSYNQMLPADFNSKGFFDYAGYNHYALFKAGGHFVVLSSKNLNSVDFITSFSYLFTFYGLLLLPLLFRINSKSGFTRTMSLAMKIQAVLISLVFLSLLAFGWGSGIFVSNQYNQFTHDVIREKMSSVETEIAAKMINFNDLDINKDGNFMQRRLEKLAGVFFTDINMYDEDGYLLATSRPKVFNVGLLSEQMNPIAYNYLRYKRQSEFVHLENIGELNYSSAYKPFYNHEGKLLAYINLQHFGQQREFENQIQKFMVAIINVFILLLAISIILAIFISNWLTSPLRILQESFAKVKFGKHNEQIEYDKEDEIGALVKDYNQKLEELEYTAQQLARSERELAWREMAKQVAHEIKNPLTPMKLSVQQLLRTYNPDDPKSGEKLNKVANSIIEQIDALTNIANEFATFAKMPNPSEEKFNLVALIRGVKQVFEQDGRAKINIATTAEEINIKADKDQFVRVFNNLIKNAIQAIPSDRAGIIEINSKVEHGKVIVTIKDNGVGIAEDQQSKIFVPYFTTKSTGTGLGLAMVKQIIQNHRGDIDFETEVNNGTTFIIQLPIAE